MIGLRKINKSNPLQSAIFNTPPILIGGIFLFGRIGSGKSTGMISLSQKYHDHPDRKYKIMHLWGGDRNEQMYWLLPSRDFKYWDKVKKTLRLEQEGPKQYKVNVLYPMTSDLRHKLPQKQPYINSKVFTIPITSIETDDISLVIGDIAPTNEHLWREAKDMMRKNDNGAHLLKYFKKLSGENTMLYKGFVSPLVKHKLLQGEYSNYNLDLISEMKDKESITVLALDFIEKDFRLFVMGWILRQISVLLDNGKIPSKNILIIQEAAEFFRATDDSISPARYKIFRRQLAHYIRMGRRGMHMFMDAQSPSEVRGMVDGSQDLTIFGKLTGEADKEAGTKQLHKDNLMSKRQIQDLSVLNPGEYYISETGKKVKKRYFFLPRTMYWQKGYGNFYDHVWKSYVDQWKDVRPIIDEIIEDYEKKKKEIERDEELKKEAARVAKEKEREKAMQEKLAELEEKELIKQKVKALRRRASKDVDEIEELSRVMSRGVPVNQDDDSDVTETEENISEEEDNDDVDITLPEIRHEKEKRIKREKESNINTEEEWELD